MTLSTVKRLASDIFGVGVNKIRINPAGTKEAEGALTRADVRGLIEKGLVIKLPPQGRDSTAKKRRVGHGHRRGTPVSAKEIWMVKVRAQRRFLRALIADGALKGDDKRAIYYKVKSGIFRNKRAMLLYLKENKFVASEYEPKKAEYKKPVHASKNKQASAKVAQQSTAATKSSASTTHAAKSASESHQAHSTKKGEKK